MIVCARMIVFGMIVFGAICRSMAGGTLVEHLPSPWFCTGLQEGMAAKKKKQTDDRRIICENRKARHEYHVLETLEAGIALSGSEVKSLRAGKGHLTDAYVRIEHGEMWLVNAHIAPYEQANRYNHESRATRKLLVKRAEIESWFRRIREKGLTGVPLKMYFKGSWVKVQIALAQGKAEYDKRYALREKQDKREMQRAMRDRQRD
jgi:SsrA-binding protein